MKIFTKRIIKKWQNFIIIFVLIVLLLHWSLMTNKIKLEKFDFKKELNQSFRKQITLKSFCSCRPDVTILNHERLENFYKKDDNYFLFETNPKNIERFFFKEKYGIKNENFFINPHFTCDLDKVFSHGVGKKVLSYSFYGKNKDYIKTLELIAEQAKKLYPGWIIRIYYNSSIEKTVICDFECKYDYVFFCDVRRVPFKNQTGINFFKFNKVHHDKELFLNDLSFLHGMMWRWFPIADDFIDFFSSRDIDSTLIQREIDSVNVWLESNTLFHIMRDNPYHNIEILGGMWGFSNKRNRKLGYNLYEGFINSISYNLNKNNRKGLDQAYLKEKVWNQYAKNNATIHDSYLCEVFGGEPFPSQRPENLYCFVSCFDPCCHETHNQTQRMPICPMKCRLKPEWERC